MLFLAKDASEFDKYLLGRDKVFDSKDLDWFNRKDHPDRFKKEVDGRFNRLIKTVSNYDYAMYNNTDILDSIRLGKVLTTILKKKENV